MDKRKRIAHVFQFNHMRTEFLRGREEEKAKLHLRDFRYETDEIIGYCLHRSDLPYRLRGFSGAEVRFEDFTPNEDERLIAVVCMMGRDGKVLGPGGEVLWPKEKSDGA